MYILVHFSIFIPNNIIHDDCLITMIIPNYPIINTNTHSILYSRAMEYYIISLLKIIYYHLQ